MMSDDTAAFEETTGLNPSEDFLNDDNQLQYWKLISTLLGGIVVFAGALVTSTAETIAEFHLWGLSVLASAYSDTIGAVFGGSGYVIEQSWIGAATQAEQLGMLAPWFMLLDVLVVFAIIFAARRWGPL